VVCKDEFHSAILLGGKVQQPFDQHMAQERLDSDEIAANKHT